MMGSSMSSAEDQAVGVEKGTFWSTFYALQTKGVGAEASLS